MGSGSAVRELRTAAAPVAAPFGEVLRTVAIDVVAAQAALDAHARDRPGDSHAGLRPPPIAFYFREVCVDLAVDFSLRWISGRGSVVALPSNPESRGFFGEATFGGRLRARIAPLRPLVAWEETVP